MRDLIRHAGPWKYRKRRRGPRPGGKVHHVCEIKEKKKKMIFYFILLKSRLEGRAPAQTLCPAAPSDCWYCTHVENAVCVYMCTAPIHCVYYTCVLLYYIISSGFFSSNFIFKRDQRFSDYSIFLLMFNQIRPRLSNQIGVDIFYNFLLNKLIFL